MTELSAEAVKLLNDHKSGLTIAGEALVECVAKDFYTLAKQESLAKIEKLEARIEALLKGLSWYAAIGEDDDSKLEDCLERAMSDRVEDKTTINLGGKYVAEVAIKTLAADGKAKDLK